MLIDRRITVLLGLLLWIAPCALAGSGDAAARGQTDASYAARESAAGSLESFAGGGDVRSHSLPADSTAAGQRATRDEQAQYAARDAASTDLETFTGGNAALVILVIVAIVAIVVLIARW